MQGERDLILEDEDGVVEPRNPENEGRAWEPEKELLSTILDQFNAMFSDEREADTMRELVVGPMSHDAKLKSFASTSSDQNVRAEFMDALEKQLYQNLGAYSGVITRMGNDQEFKENFGPMMFRLWQASIAAGNS